MLEEFAVYLVGYFCKVQPSIGKARLFLASPSIFLPSSNGWIL
jgi:hypothetical protein